MRKNVSTFDLALGVSNVKVFGRYLIEQAHNEDRLSYWAGDGYVLGFDARLCYGCL